MLPEYIEGYPVLIRPVSLLNYLVLIGFEDVKVSSCNISKVQAAMRMELNGVSY